ncbi:MAG: hypothetical protein AAGG01_19115, partial [Planctomycetota bacterium]
MALTLSGLLFPGVQGDSPDRSPVGAVVRLDIGAEDPSDPRTDGWQTEALAQDIGGALKPLKKLLESGPPEGWNQADLPESLTYAGVVRIADEHLQVVRDTPSFRSVRFAPRPDG